MNIDTKSREIISNLKSSDPDFLLETINQVRNSGNNIVLSHLIDLLHNTNNIEIKKDILNLISEIKDQASVPSLISAIKDEKYNRELKDLVACCWQNGLGYNEYLPVFIDLIINEEFLIAFEAFTVIENMYGRVEDEIIEKETIKINEALKGAIEQKVYLLNGLLTMIQDIPEKQEFTD